MANLPKPPNDENASPTTPPRPPVEEVEDPPLATPHTAGETDILDESLACLEGSLRAAEGLDETALSLATALAEKGDDASIMRAHAVLGECGVAMGDEGGGAGCGMRDWTIGWIDWSAQHAVASGAVEARGCTCRLEVEVERHSSAFRFV